MSGGLVLWLAATMPVFLAGSAALKWHVTGGGASAFLADTSSSNSDWSNLLSSLDLPVTVLHGESDPAVNPRLARLAASRIANSRYQEIPGIGQQILHTMPHKIIAALEEMAPAKAD